MKTETLGITRHVNHLSTITIQAFQLHWHIAWFEDGGGPTLCCREIIHFPNHGTLLRVPNNFVPLYVCKM